MRVVVPVKVPLPALLKIFMVIWVELSLVTRLLEASKTSTVKVLMAEPAWVLLGGWLTNLNFEELAGVILKGLEVAEVRLEASALKV